MSQEHQLAHRYRVECRHCWEGGCPTDRDPCGHCESGGCKATDAEKLVEQVARTIVDTLFNYGYDPVEKPYDGDHWQDVQFRNTITRTVEMLEPVATAISALHDEAADASALAFDWMKRAEKAEAEVTALRDAIEAAIAGMKFTISAHWSLQVKPILDAALTTDKGEAGSEAAPVAALRERWKQRADRLDPDSLAWTVWQHAIHELAALTNKGEANGTDS